MTTIIYLYENVKHCLKLFSIVSNEKSSSHTTLSTSALSDWGKYTVTTGYTDTVVSVLYVSRYFSGILKKK